MAPIDTTRLTRRHVLAALACLLPAPALGRHPEDALSLTTGMREPWTQPDKTGFTDGVVAEAFRRMGRSVDLTVNLAASRAIQLADDGIDDGLAARVKGLDAKYANLVRVDEPIFHNDFVACSLGLPLATNAWSDLVPYSVGHIIGWQVFQDNLPQVRELTLAKDSAQLLTLLGARRVEVILHERWQALWHARSLGMDLSVHEPPLARVPMFVYLHRRHAVLAPTLAATLAAMKADGTYDRIAGQAFSGLKSRLLP